MSVCAVPFCGEPATETVALRWEPRWEGDATTGIEYEYCAFHAEESYGRAKASGKYAVVDWRRRVLA